MVGRHWRPRSVCSSSTRASTSTPRLLGHGLLERGDGCPAAAILILGWQSADLRRPRGVLLAVPLCVLRRRWPSIVNWATCPRCEPLGSWPPAPSRRIGSTSRGWPRWWPTVCGRPGERSCRSASPTTSPASPIADELVYLPPAWFESSPPPAAVMMIGAEIGRPATGSKPGRLRILDEFARDTRHAPWLCSPTPPAPSPMTPSASMDHVATPPTTSPKMLCPT